MKLLNTMKDHMEDKPEQTPEMVLSSRNCGFNKKIGRSILQTREVNFFQGYTFWIVRDVPKIYEKQLTDLHYTRAHSSRMVVMLL